MKKITILVVLMTLTFVILQFISCNKIKGRNSSNELSIDSVKVYDLRKVDTDNRHLYKISIKLSNHTKQHFKFWVMDCTWTDQFSFSNNSIMFIQECFRNKIKLIDLVPEESYCFYGDLVSEYKIDRKFTNDLSLYFDMYNASQMNQTQFNTNLSNGKFSKKIKFNCKIDYFEK